MSMPASPRPWRVNGHSIEANDPDGLWLKNEKTGWGVVANLPSCPKYRMSKKNRETWDAIVEANAALIVAAVNEREAVRDALRDMEADAEAAWEGTPLRRALVKYAARLREALDATARAPGNAAAMREALEDSLKFWNSISTRTRREENLRLEIAAALDAPARNADRFATVKDAAIAFAREKTDAPLPCPDFTFSAWLMAPEKGGAE